jgi:hypothetical protein
MKDMTRLKFNAFLCLLGLHGKIETSDAVTMVGCTCNEMTPIPDFTVKVHRCSRCSKVRTSIKKLSLAEAQQVKAAA